MRAIGDVVLKRERLKRMIADAYCRMATNPERAEYVDKQMKKCEGWRKELEELFKEDPYAFSLPSE